MGIFDKGIGNIAGAIFNPASGAAALGFGPGKTGSPNPTYRFSGDPSGPTDNPNAERIAQIQQRIAQGQGAGTYGEGAIAAANREFNALRSQLNNGEIDQKTYVEIADALYPSITQYINAVSSSGSGGANAARAAGGDQFLSQVGRDYQIYKSAQEILGRDVTANELAQFAPLFGAGGQKELESGRAAMAQLADAEKNSPEALDRRYRESAPKYQGQVGNVFQELLKRGASQPELDHFGKMLASGEIDEYELQSFVQQMPEYRTGQDKEFREGLNTELAQYDQEAFGKAKEDVISRYARAGIKNSPSLDFALTNLMGDIAKERQRYLSGLSADQYGGNKNLARADYETNLNRIYGNQDYRRDRSDYLSDAARSRSYEVSDYFQQQRDLERLMSMNQGGRQRNPYGQMAGGIAAIATKNPAFIPLGQGFDYWNS